MTEARRESATAIAVIAVAALLAFSNSFRGTWIFDDRRAFLEATGNEPTWENFTRMLKTRQPVSYLTRMLNHAISGKDPWSHHAFNLLVHVGAGVAAFAVVRATLRALRPEGSWFHVSLAIAVLWLVHPLQTESVTYVVQRNQSLMGAFELAFFYCLIRSREGSRRWQLAAVAASRSRSGPSPTSRSCPSSR